MSASYERVVRDLITLMGDDPCRPGLEETPRRVLESYRELFSGYAVDVRSLLKEFEQEGDAPYTGIVLNRNIEFYSTCEHHLLPFYGVAHVAYIPSKKLIGLSKLARIVDVYSRRLQCQERITAQVVQALGLVQPKGAAAILSARHACVACRGVNKQHSDMVTSVFTGAFKSVAARNELEALIAMP